MNPRRLLIVDDETALLELLRRFLERRGFQVDTAASFVQALELFQGSPAPYAMVVTDLALEHGSGEDLIAIMRKTQPDLPALIASGYPYHPRLPGVAFLQKPLLPQVLVDAVQNALSKTA